jgi:hypothetical protein
MTFLALIFDIRTAQVQFSKTIVQIFALFFYSDNGMNKNRIDGCLGIHDSFGRFVNDLLTVFAGEEPGISSVSYSRELHSLGNDIMPLGSVGILTRLKSSLELRKDVDQNFCRILLQPCSSVLRPVA